MSPSPFAVGRGDHAVRTSRSTACIGRTAHSFCCGLVPASAAGLPATATPRPRTATCPFPDAMRARFPRSSDGVPVWPDRAPVPEGAVLGSRRTRSPSEPCRPRRPAGQSLTSSRRTRAARGCTRARPLDTRAPTGRPRPLARAPYPGLPGRGPDGRRHDRQRRPPAPGRCPTTPALRPARPRVAYAVAGGATAAGAASTGGLGGGAFGSSSSSAKAPRSTRSFW